MTASLALRNSPRIPAKTRQRIQRLAQKLGHVPNPRLGELMNEVRRGRTPRLHATLGLIALFPEEFPEQRWPHLGQLAAAAQARAEKLGYKLQRFWTSAPGMSPRRLRGILDARGINGILCLGSLDADAAFPKELDMFAVVTLGMSISTHLHRVGNHHHSDGMLVCEQLLAHGYRRPGLIMDPDWERRTGFCYTSANLLFQDRLHGKVVVPGLRMERYNRDQLHRWLSEYQPDAVVLHQTEEFYRGFEEYIDVEKIRVPHDLGAAFVGTRPSRRFYAGVAQDHSLIGACGLEMLVGRVHQRDFGFPEVPKYEMVEGRWIDGGSVRRL